MNTLQAVILLILSYFIVSSFNLEQSKRVIIRKLSMCKGAEKLPMRWLNITLKYDGKTKVTHLGLKVRLLKEINGKFEMSFNFLRCETVDNPDTCEFIIRNYKNNRICDYMDMKNAAWSEFLEAFNKPVKCPLQPGLYILEKLEVKSDFLKYLPVSEGFWRARLQGFLNGELMCCMETVIQIVLGRST